MSAPQVPESVDREEFVRASDLVEWEGPFTELDKNGNPTGHAYVRCPECGREVMTSGRENLDHDDGCEFGGDRDE